MGWHPFNLDHLAMEIVLKARSRDPDSLNQAYKMRISCSYGLERFWGEHLRLADKEIAKAAFIVDVWKCFVSVIRQARPDLPLPATMLSKNADEELIQSMAQQLWSIDIQDQQACIAVLTGLCDSVVWWVQRLKGARGAN
jgi:hypothetical protein